MESFNGERVVKLEENGYELIKRLQSGEKIICKNCQKGYYITSSNNLKETKDFACEKCGSVIRVSPNIVVE